MPATETVGDEDREVPEGDAHREPDQSCHQRFLPCFRFLRPPDCSRARRRAAALASLSSGRSGWAPPLPAGASPSPPSPCCRRADRCGRLGLGGGLRPCRRGAGRRRNRSRLLGSAPGISVRLGRARPAREFPPARLLRATVHPGHHVLLRECRDHAAHLLLDPLAPAPVCGLPLLPMGQDRRRDEDRRIRTGGEADHHREGEVLQGRAAEDVEHRHQEDGRQTRDQGSGQNLAHGAVDDLGEGRAGQPRHVLAHAVEHDDRVVERVPKDGQERGDGAAGHLPPRQRIDASRDQDVVDEGDDHRYGVLGLEPERDVGADHQQREDDRVDRRCSPPAGRRSGRPWWPRSRWRRCRTWTGVPLDRLDLLRLRRSVGSGRRWFRAACSSPWDLGRR